jgi:hypothetical protein
LEKDIVDFFPGIDKKVKVGLAPDLYIHFYPGIPLDTETDAILVNSSIFLPKLSNYISSQRSDSNFID